MGLRSLGASECMLLRPLADAATCTLAPQVLDAGGGQTLWSVDKPAVGASSSDSSAPSFRPAATFDLTQGQLAALRCLGQGASPTSICVYSGFAPVPRVVSGAVAAWSGSSSWAAAIGAAAAALFLT